VNSALSGSCGDGDPGDPSELGPREWIDGRHSSVCSLIEKRACYSFPFYFSISMNRSISC
jgi:hypothetical protein